MMEITYFEFKRRLGLLNRARVLVSELPANLRQVSPEQRRGLNALMPILAVVLSESGQYPSVTVREAPASGGTVWPEIDALSNLFTASYYNDFRQRTLDSIDRSIGIYQLERRASIARTINPFWWIWRLFAWIARLPFRLFSWAGFDGERAESSAAGKLTKIVLVIVGFFGFFASVLAILDSQTFQDIVGRLF